MDPQTKSTVQRVARSFAGSLVNHPMLSTLLRSSLAAHGVAITKETEALMLKESAGELHRLVKGGCR